LLDSVLPKPRSPGRSPPIGMPRWCAAIPALGWSRPLGSWPSSATTRTAMGSSRLRV